MHDELSRMRRRTHRDPQNADRRRDPVWDVFSHAPSATAERTLRYPAVTVKLTSRVSDFVDRACR